jgi:hypothetical protein
MKKFEKDGMIGVLYSPGFGAGWSTWTNTNAEGMCMDYDLVKAVLEENRHIAADIAEERYGAYTGGAEDLVVEWVDKGDQFEISEYDGNERLVIIGQQTYMIA